MKGKQKKSLFSVEKIEIEKVKEKLRQKDKQKNCIMQEPFVVWLTVVRMMSGFEKGMTDRKKNLLENCFSNQKITFKTMSIRPLKNQQTLICCTIVYFLNT